MARGDIVLFQEFTAYFGKSMMNFPSGGDTFKSAVIDNTAAPTAADVAPKWGSYSANEVSGTNYTAGGEALANQAYTQTAGVAKFDADDVQWTQHASGPANMYWNVNYNDSDTVGPDSAYCYVDMGGPVSLVDGNVAIKWNVGGIFLLSIV